MAACVALGLCVLSRNVNFGSHASVSAIADAVKNAAFKFVHIFFPSKKYTANLLRSIEYIPKGRKLLKIIFRFT